MDLVDICKNDDIERFKLMLANEHELSTVLNYKTEHNENLFLIASKHGADSIVKLIIDDERFNDLYEYDDDGYNAFLYACVNNYTKIVALILEDERFTDIYCEYQVKPTNYYMDGYDGLRLAWRNGHHEVVKLILDDTRYDYDLNSTTIDSNEYTLLTYACMHGYVELVKILINDENFDGVNDACDPGGNPLHRACCAENIDIIMELLKHEKIRVFNSEYYSKEIQDILNKYLEDPQTFRKNLIMKEIDPITEL